MQRWSVRGIDPEVIDMVHEVSASSDMTIGEVINTAISEWYDALEDESGEEDINISEFDGTALTGPRRFWIPGEVEFEEVPNLG